MPDKYDQAIDSLYGAPAASSAIAATAGVSPAAAAGVINNPLPNVPPSVSMYDAQRAQDLAKQTQQNAFLQTNPRVAKYIAGADPADVAAVKENLPSLAKVDYAAEAWKGYSGPVGSIAESLGSAWQQLQTDVQKDYATHGEGNGGLFGPEISSVVIVKDLLGFIAPGFAAGLDPAARAEASVPSVMYDNSGKPILGGAARLAQARKDVGLAAFGLAHKAGRLSHGPRPDPIDLGTLNPQQRLSGPTTEPIDVEFSDITPPVSGVPALGVHPGVDALRGELANVDSLAIGHIQDTLAESPILKASPTTLTRFLEDKFPGETVSVDPDKLLELSQAGHEPFPSFASQIVQASQEGTDVDIPLSHYLTATAGQPFAKELNEATTFRQDGTSVADAKTQPPVVEPGNELAQQLDRGASPSPPSESRALVPTGEPPLTSEETTRAQAIAAAAHDQLSQVVKAQFLSPLVKDPATVGMTKEQFRRYSKAIDVQAQKARDVLSNRAVAQVIRERKPDWKAALAQHTDAAGRELAQRPDINAYSALMRGKTGLGELLERGTKLNSGDQVSQYGKDLGLPEKMFSRTGLAADDVASSLGFQSGTTMVQALAKLHGEMGGKTWAEHLKALTAVEADARTQNELAHDVTLESLHAAASELMNAPMLTDFLSEELQLLAKKAGLPLDLPAVKAYAAQRFGNLSISEATNIQKWEKYIYKGGTKAELALSKGDPAAAFVRKLQQFIHHLQLQEAHKFLKEFGKGLKQFKSLAKDRKKKAISQSYLDAIHSELQRYGYKVPQANLKYNYETWAKTQKALGFTVPPYTNIPEQFVASLTVGQFRELADRIDYMARNGREDQKTLDRVAQMKAQELTKRAVEGATGVQRKSRTNETNPPIKRLRQWDAELSKAEFMFDKLDGGDPNGVFNQVLMHGANDAHSVEKTSQREVLDQAAKLRNALSKNERAGWATKVPEGHGLLDPMTGEEMALTNYDLLSAFANMGNKTNLWHLGEGGWNWEMEKLMPVLERGITPEGAGFVQDIWDILEKNLWPKIVSTERGLTSLVPERVEPSSVTLNGKIYKGGYFPLVRDALRTERMGPSVSDIDKLASSFRDDAKTDKGFTKQRTGAKYPVLLDLQNVLFDHVSKVTKRIAYEGYLQEASQFLRNKEVSRLVNDVHGEFGMQQIVNWLHRQVGFRLIDPRAIQSASSFFRQWRENTYMVGAGLRITVGLEHLSQVSQLAATAGERATVEGYVRTALDPLGSVRFALDNSHVLSSRVDEVNRELRDIFEDLKDQRRTMPKVLSWAEAPKRFVQQCARFALTWINQYTLAIPAWIGSYYAALRGTTFKGKKLNPMSHEDAVRYADKIVTESHSSGAEKDLSQFQSGGNDFFRLLNMYYNYHGSQLQLTRGAIYRMAHGRDTAERVEGLREGFWAIITSAVVGNFVAGRASKILDEIKRKNPHATRDAAIWTADVMLGGLAQGVPILREGYQMVDNRLQGREWNYNVSPIAQGPEVIGQAAEDLLHYGRNAFGAHDKVSTRAIQHIVEAPGYFMGLPTGQAGASAQGLADLHNPGNIHPLAGITYGPSHEKDAGTKSMYPALDPKYTPHFHRM